MSRAADWAAEELQFVGVLLGLAVYNGVLLDVHVPKVSMHACIHSCIHASLRFHHQSVFNHHPSCVHHVQVFYRKLLLRQLTLIDLASIDPQLATGLQALLSFEPADQVETTFCRTFEVTWEAYGETHRVELVPGGCEKAVTGENREEFVKAYIQWALADSITTQWAALAQGFGRAVHLSSLLLLSPEELELLMVGQPHLDFKELEAHTAYVGEDGWDATHPTVRAFWSAVHELSLEDKQRLLLFATGSSRSPIGGLGKLGLKLQRAGPDSDHLPTAHTCFNTLLLPEYSSPEKLKDRLTKAISECEGFGLK